MKEILGQGLGTGLARTLIDYSPIAYIILDDEYRVHYINDSFLKLRKLELDTVLGEKCYNISNRGIPCQMCAVKGALKDEKKTFLSRKDILPDGTVRYVDDYAIPLEKNPETGKQFVLEIMVDRTAEMLQREKRNVDYEQILSIFAQLLEMKDQYTATHSDAVRKLAIKLAKALSLPDQDVLDISLAASLHDLGKVKVPDEIINKPGPLSDEEFATIKKHPLTSFEFLSALSTFGAIKHIVRSHHERVDGKGYPDGLSGGELSLGAKIVAVVDTYDAITSTRSYRKGRSHEYALEEIKRVSGSQLDPQVVDAFLSMDFDLDDNEAVSYVQDKRLERYIDPVNVITESKEIDKNDFGKVKNQDHLINQILEHTPCGYVLMDTEKHVLYASSYFLEYMNMTEDQLLGKVCYRAGGIGSKPCECCPIERAVQSAKVEFDRQEQTVGGNLRIFDLYGMPILNDEGKVQAVIEMIIDRTEEALIERRREQDFNKLVALLSGFLDEQSEGKKEDISDQVQELRQRLNDTLEKMKNEEDK